MGREEGWAQNCCPRTEGPSQNLEPGREPWSQGFLGGQVVLGPDQANSPELRVWGTSHPGSCRGKENKTKFLPCPPGPGSHPLGPA